MTTAAEQGLETEISRLRAEIAEREAKLRPLEQALAVLRGGSPADVAGRSRASTRRRGARTTLVLELLADAPDGMTRAELARALDEEGEEDLLSNGLSYLKRNGKVRRSADGRWSLAQ